jgi:hypothetical protein
VTRVTWGNPLRDARVTGSLDRYLLLISPYALLPAHESQLWSCLVQIPDDCLTNRIFGFDYGLWWYRIPLPFDGNPTLGDRMFSNHSRMAGGTSLNCPRSIAAAVALTAQNMSVAMSGLALAIVFAMCPSRLKRIAIRTCTLCDGGVTAGLCDLRDGCAQRLRRC